MDKDTLYEHIMQAIRSLRADANGTAIRDWIEAQTDKEMATARVYVALQRLEDDGVVSSYVEENVKRTPRRIYELTGKGLYDHNTVMGGMRLRPV